MTQGTLFDPGITDELIRELDEWIGRNREPYQWMRSEWVKDARNGHVSMRQIWVAASRKFGGQTNPVWGHVYRFKNGLCRPMALHFHSEYPDLVEASTSKKGQEYADVSNPAYG